MTTLRCVSVLAATALLGCSDGDGQDAAPGAEPDVVADAGATAHPGAGGSPTGGHGGDELELDSRISPLPQVGSDSPTVLEDGSECFEGTFTPFWGDLHSHLTNHTVPPDCKHTAAELLDEAIARGLNFIQITEHVWRLTANGLAACNAAAAARISPTFRPDCGFETNVGMADGKYSGHANALWAPNNHNTSPSDAVGEDFYGASGKSNFYHFIDDNSLIGQINHPNSTEDGWPDSSSSYANGAIDLVEVSGNCGGCADRDAAAIKKFLAFVDGGWKVGPSMNSDTHCLTPGRRTGAWVAKSSIKKALRNHRTFVQSYEPPKGDNNGFRLDMVANETSDGSTHHCWMGSTLKRPTNGNATLRVKLEGHMVASGASGSIKMKIFASGHGYDSPLESATCGASGSSCKCAGDGCVWALENVPTAGTGWFVAYAESDVGENVGWTLSSPVWLSE